MKENVKRLNLYIVYTGNRHNQILFFETYKDAYNWLKSSTIWNDKKIRENILQPYNFPQNNYYTVYENGNLSIAKEK